MVRRKAAMELAEHYAELLRDIAPEIALRGILHDCGESAPSPLLYRVLISVLLRASNAGIAESVHEVLCSCSGVPPADRLGFTSLTTSGESGATLHDILTSLVREQPLRLGNPALDFYSVAGVGSADPEEFHRPSADGLSVEGFSAEFGEPIYGIAETRKRSLCLAVDYFAMVVAESSRGSTPLPVGDSRLLSGLVEDMRLNVAKMQPRTLRAANSFLDAALRVADEQDRADAVRRLVTAFQDIASKQPDSLLLFISGLTHADVKFRACVSYLRQRFGASHSMGPCDSSTLKIRTFLRDFLEVKIVEGRANSVLPVVFTGLIQAWLEDADLDCFDVEDTRRIGNRINTRKEVVIEACKPNTRDETEFHLSVMALTMRMIVSTKAKLAQAELDKDKVDKTR